MICPHTRLPSKKLPKFTKKQLKLLNFENSKFDLRPIWPIGRPIIHPQVRSIPQKTHQKNFRLKSKIDEKNPKN